MKTVAVVTTGQNIVPLEEMKYLIDRVKAATYILDYTKDMLEVISLQHKEQLEAMLGNERLRQYEDCMRRALKFVQEIGG